MAQVWLAVNLTGSRINQTISPRAHLWGTILIGLCEGGRPTLVADGTVCWQPGSKERKACFFPPYILLLLISSSTLVLPSLLQPQLQLHPFTGIRTQCCWPSNINWRPTALREFSRPSALGLLGCPTSWTKKHLRVLSLSSVEIAIAASFRPYGISQCIKSLL